MKHLFYIQGYGVSKDILKNENYNRYLNYCFNYIYDYARENYAVPTIIFSGGKTDMFRPYQRTEAGEMKKLFLHLAKREFVKKVADKWRYGEIKTSLSTVEGLLKLKEIAKIKAKFFIFCEKTREARISVLADKLFGRKAKVIGVDFDVSPRCYVKLEEIKNHEQNDLARELRIIKNPALLKKWRAEKLARIEKLRKLKPDERKKFFVEEYRGKY